MTPARARAPRDALLRRGRISGAVRRGRLSCVVVDGGCCGIGMLDGGHGSAAAGGPLPIACVPPGRADVLIVSGTVNAKMAHEVRAIFDEMPHPKWVVAVGSCAGNGPFEGYANVVADVGVVVPVDVRVAGCPPSADAVRAGLESLTEIIASQAEENRAARG